MCVCVCVCVFSAVAVAVLSYSLVETRTKHERAIDRVAPKVSDPKLFSTVSMIAIDIGGGETRSCDVAD